jgi:hypothetical protein
MRPTLATLAARAAACGASAVGVGGLVAGAVALGGLADDVRDGLAFAFPTWPRTPARALEVAAQNLRLVLAVLLCAGAASRVGPAMRGGLDLLLAGAWLHNVVLVGAAWGAYGARLGTAIALHLPLELAATSLAGGVYICGRQTQPSVRVLLFAAGTSLVLLGAGGYLETYTPLVGRR